MSSNIAEIKDLTSTNELALVQSESKRKGVLCTLEGPFGSYSEPTRNKRLYIDELWDKILNSDEVAEMLETKTFFGEADHPLAYQDRLETHVPQISHCVTSVKKLPNGTIYGTIDVLDTPNGRIVKTLVDYGSKLGISTRGAGQVVEHPKYGRIVDPDTYTFVTWDIVVMPGAKVARLGRVDESVNNTDTLKSQLVNQVTEAINKRDINALQSMSALLESVKDSELSILRDSANSILATRTDTFSIEAGSELLEAYGKISELNNKLSTTSEALEITKSNLTSKYDSLRESYNKVLSDKSRLEDTIFSKDNKINEYKVALNKSNDKLKLVEQEFSAKEESLKTDISLLTEKVNNLQTQLNESKDMELQSMILADSKISRLDDLELEVDSLHESCSRLKESNKSLLNEYVTLKCRTVGVDPALLPKVILTESTDVEVINDYIRDMIVTQSRTRLNESASKMLIDNSGVAKCKSLAKKSDSKSTSHIDDIKSTVALVKGF